ncbi:DUF6765 family protein [Salinispira pacifica]
MNHEFHYYTLHYLASQAGFNREEAYVLAYSSQYLDNALVSYEIETERGPYATLVTHHFGFWNRRQEKEVWIPFHFFPGDDSFEPARRVDGRSNPYNVTPNSTRLKRYLIEALKSRNLYRVGIALHTYADSWAHQNFSGRNEEWNRVDENSVIPPIGHAQALASPDNLDGIWEDPRLQPAYRLVRNRDRFFAAAQKIYAYLCTFNRRPFDDWELVAHKLEELLGRQADEKSGKERVLDFIIDQDVPEYRRNEWRGQAFFLNASTGDEDVGSTYDKLLWLRNEVLHETKLVEKRPVRARPGFYGSHLYRWNEAAIVQRRSAIQILGTLVSD